MSGLPLHNFNISTTYMEREDGLLIGNISFSLVNDVQETDLSTVVLRAPVGMYNIDKWTRKIRKHSFFSALYYLGLEHVSMAMFPTDYLVLKEISYDLSRNKHLARVCISTCDEIYTIHVPYEDYGIDFWIQILGVIEEYSESYYSNNVVFHVERTMNYKWEKISIGGMSTWFLVDYTKKIESSIKIQCAFRVFQSKKNADLLRINPDKLFDKKFVYQRLGMVVGGNWDKLLMEDKLN